MKQVLKLNYDTLPNKLSPYFYKSICFYDKIKSIQTDKEFNNRIPNITNEINLIFSKGSLNTKTRAELQDWKITLNNVIYFTKDKTKILSFLRHFRNAISHDNLIYDRKNKIFNITDYDRNQLTAIGQFNETFIIEFINLLSKKYKLI